MNANEQEGEKRIQLAVVVPTNNDILGVSFSFTHLHQEMDDIVVEDAMLVD